MTRPTLVFARLATLAACSRSDKPAASNEAATQAPASAAEPALSPLDAAIAGSWRDPANAARDSWRHPAQTLRFFGVTPEQTVRSEEHTAELQSLMRISAAAFFLKKKNTLQHRSGARARLRKHIRLTHSTQCQYGIQSSAITN